jgi:WD40 repeat protein
VCSHEQIFLRRHSEEITAIGLSEHFIATGQLGKQHSKELAAPVCVWALEDKKLIYEFGAHTTRITALAFSPDERFLATGGEDELICVWDLKSGTMMSSYRTDKKVSSCLFF